MIGVSPGIELVILHMCTVDPPANFVSDLVAAAATHNLDPLLLAAVVVTETRCNSDAVGAAGEIGLMQIHPGTWQAQEYNADKLHSCTGLTWSDGHDPAQNMLIGGWILSTAINTMRGDVRRGLALYNGYSEQGLRYADKVLTRYNAAKRQHP